MLDLFEAAVSAPNIIPSALLVLVILYWLAVIAGILDLDLIDLDIEIDTEADFSVAWLNHILIFLNLGQIPVMIFITFLVLPMWIVSVLANYYLSNSSFLISLVLLIPNFVVCLLIAKVLTIPFVKFFNFLNKEEEAEAIIGKIGVALVSIYSDRSGQVKVETKESPLLLNVITNPGTTIQAGETGLIVDYIPHKNIYLIEPFETL